MKTRVELGCPKQSHIVRGPVSCITWVTARKDSCETLCYGTGLGYLVFWHQNARDVSGAQPYHSRLIYDSRVTLRSYAQSDSELVARSLA